jgi:hypothetical protein
MNLFSLFAMLLMVTQAPVPVPRQTSDSGATSTQHPKKTANSGQQPALAAPAVTLPKESNTPTLKPDTDQQKPNDAQQSVTVSKLPPVTIARNGIDWGVISNYLLVAVGIGGIVVAIRTLKKVEQQTAATEKAAIATQKSARATMKSVKLQEAQLRQWVEIAAWEAITPHTQQDATEAVLTISFSVFNPTEMVLTLNSVLVTAGPIWEQGHGCSSMQMQYVLAPDSGFPVSVEMEMKGDVFSRYKRYDLNVVVAIDIGFEDAFEVLRSQRLVFTSECGPGRRDNFTVSQSTHAVQNGKAAQN